MNFKILFYFLFFCIFLSCKPKVDDVTIDYNPTKKSVVSQYSTIVHATYLDAYEQAVIFKKKVNEFVAAPSQNRLEELKKFYALDLRPPYNQSDAFRFYGGPIDNEETGKEGNLNGWPLDEDVIDYVVSNGQRIDSGIINSPIQYPVITKELLESANGKLSETSLYTGYHAIEFLLWGQDLYENGPGQRPYTDYLIEGGTALHQDRRGQMLKLVTEMLVEDLQFTLNEWLPSKNNYRKEFETQPVDRSIALIITGLGKLTKGELFGERLLTFYNIQDQEEEHSCFSDLTTEDLIMNQQGIMNVYYGKYQKKDGIKYDGVGLDELVDAVNPALNAQMKQKMEDAKAALVAIPKPFDKNTSSLNPAGRESLRLAGIQGGEQAIKFTEVANSLKISLAL